ncbi:MAG: ATP-dependent DNA helicase RecG [Candidatus Magasanikbacteria bacterium RIFCSPHIGHO2_02_FULL_45_10]|uniref:ATP-dependent DNA helicase RecG n=1 Tax=Candidatus Magasanikbacteria bacterium RIFCSPHIGHO2_02_FULL_45_10 TaxID=1798679 RepID=A0A1F6MC28_9BACT|nr:MAG: ATP-dependent DNA helicase RecG [Candidatus Magasanikbacteria bacterium RIFCSPHIGHO2_02_FULL_45_10]
MDKVTRLEHLPRVGKTMVNRLHNLGLFTTLDLLYHFPFRYEDFRQLVPINQLRAGQSVTIKGKIELIANRRSPRKRMVLTETLLSDGTGSLRVVWFNQPFLTKNLAIGDEVFLSGTVKVDMLGPELVSPAYEKATTDSAHTARLVPIYPVTEGITQKQIRALVKQALPLADSIGDWVPDEIKNEFDLPPLKDALRGIHFPGDEAEIEQSSHRLKFDELLLVQLKAESVCRDRRSIRAPTFSFQETEVQQFVKKLPFTLTKSQKISTWEIIQDCTKDQPMNRLLSGDVGSGKTVVAAIALYNAALNGFQAAIMAPTEILATQHFASLTQLLPDVPIALFTRTQHAVSEKGSVAKLTKKKLAEAYAAGRVPIVIGTHALLSEGVQFRKLGLVIVDEQHRFGVAQRQVIKEKGHGVHFLSMTATPIPRSLALMIYGDLDISIINELPAGRKKIITRLVEPTKRVQAYAFIREQVSKGRQVFVVCPLIEENLSALIEKKSVMVEYEKLSKVIFKDLKVGFLHGKMKSVEKESIMEQFKLNQLNILVSTSVIEVGVNIPNATVMMIEGAERFGLAQLHQFRGRVGRSDYQSYCLLFTDSESPRVMERLRYFETHSDGFALAEKDLETRGPGEIFGTMQSGLVDLKLAKVTDKEIIKQARQAAKKITPELRRYPEVVAKLSTVWKTAHLE